MAGDSDTALSSVFVLLRSEELGLSFSTGFFLLYTCLYLRFSLSSSFSLLRPPGPLQMSYVNHHHLATTEVRMTHLSHLSRQTYPICNSSVSACLKKLAIPSISDHILGIHEVGLVLLPPLTLGQLVPSLHVEDARVADVACPPANLEKSLEAVFIFPTACEAGAVKEL